MQKLHLQHLIEKGDANAKIVARVLDHPEMFLATVLFGTNFFETAVATLGTVLAVRFWGENLGVALATIIVTVLTLVLAEYIPKSLASRFGEKIALAYARPIQFVFIVFYPFVYLLNLLGVGLTRLFGGRVEIKPMISQDEFRSIISVGHREGTVEKEMAEMLHNVFDFAERPVREVMVPRPDVIFVEQGSKLNAFRNLYAEHPLSRFPVYQGDEDNVVGALSVKDVFMAQAKGNIDSDDTIDDLVRPATFSPENKPISELLVELRNQNCHLAIVVDEFGGTAGVVTLNQLVEEIVGPIGDELMAAEKEYEIIDKYTFQVDGGMRVEDVNKEMELGLPEGEGEYETVAGFILHLLRHIPEPGEKLEYGDLKFLVSKMEGMKIQEVLITREEPVEESADEVEEKDATSAG